MLIYDNFSDTIRTTADSASASGSRYSDRLWRGRGSATVCARERAVFSGEAATPQERVARTRSIPAARLVDSRSFADRSGWAFPRAEGLSPRESARRRQEKPQSRTLSQAFVPSLRPKPSSQAFVPSFRRWRIRPDYGRILTIRFRSFVSPAHSASWAATPRRSSQLPSGILNFLNKALINL
jgi:hypothetical protein